MPLRNADKIFILSISRETYLQETIPCTIQPQKPWYLGENYSRKGIPYDYSCPAAQNIMEKRLCSKCGLYLASIKEVSLHEQMHKKQKTTPSDIPSEPPAKQSAETVLQEELLCAFQFQEFEWMELDDVDTEGLVILPVSSIRSGTPVIENSEAIQSEG